MTFDARSFAARVQGRSSQLGGAALRVALTSDADAWLTSLWTAQGDGLCLAAVGGYGRSELAPGSDLDLLLLHAPGVDASALAERLWYAVWDAGVSLDHSVRTVDEAVAVADDDLKAALGLLDVRAVVGDATLVSSVRTRVYERWRARARVRLPELQAATRARAETFGEVAFLLEPDLKEARGGLRDVLAVRQCAASQLVDPPSAELRAARDTLLDVRGTLHTVLLAGGRKASDVLRLQDSADVAMALGLTDPGGDPDVLALASLVAKAARRISFELDRTFQRVDRAVAPAPRSLFRRAPERRPLADGVVSQAGEVVLARDADTTDPVLALRVATASATSGLPVAAVALDRLTAVPPEPWSPAARDVFLALLGTGRPVVAAVETLDAAGIWERWVPEWPAVRSTPQRNAYHRFTVDRHLLETVANASLLARKVSRPDLLLLAALFHDIGKGFPGDHTDVGVEMMPAIGARMGLPAADTAALVRLIRCHILLSEVATRRDLSDPATALGVAEAVGSRDVLSVLRALSEADSAATGPAMWSPWKAGLLDDLVRRTSSVLEGSPPPPAPTDTPAEAALRSSPALVVDVAADASTVTLGGPDSDGLLVNMAGVLALRGLDVRGLDASVTPAGALVTFTCTSRFGRVPDAVVVRTDLVRALEGNLDVPAALAARARDYPVPTAAKYLLAGPAVVWADGASESASVLELRAPDAVGLLFRATNALYATGVHVAGARCSTLGHEVLDAFYVIEDGKPLTGPRRDEVAAALLAAVG